MSAVINKMATNTDWSNVKWIANDDTCFPPFMLDFPNHSFKQVYETDQDYVNFMMKVTKPTGLFKAFVEYCRIRQQSK
jgi:hypothetical protein